MRYAFLGAIALSFFFAALQPALAVVNAVRTYDENVVQVNQVDVSVADVTVGQMATNVATAFDLGRGGVIDFDNGSFTDAQTIDAAFASGTKSLRLTNSARTWQIGVLGASPSSGSISGPNVIFNGSPNPFPVPFLNTIVFGDVTNTSTSAVLPERVTSFGFTIIDASFNASGNAMHVDVSYSNGTTSTLDYFIPLAFQTQDTFFGWNAPAGAYITQISFTANNNTAGEDWAFITSPVPEPSTMAIALSGAICLLVRTRVRRRSASV